MANNNNKNDLKVELDRVIKEINRLEKLSEKMEDEGNYNSNIYKEIDALYEKKEQLTHQLNCHY